jgi:DNA modification methylase
MSKSKKYKFNSKDIEVEAKTGAQRNLIDYRKTPPRPYNNKKIPGNVWNFNRIRFLQEEYENHPTQKPEILLERIIKASSNKNDLILDPFGGSFTTGAVAKKNLRRSISFEINKDYVKIGLRRLNIKSNFIAKELVKLKKRKTKNKSKSDHSQIEKFT